MKMGAEPKKIGALAGLLVVAGIVYWMNSSDTPSAPSTTRTAAVDPAASAAAAAAQDPTTIERRRTASGHANIPDFNLKQVNKLPDPTKVDPTLRLDLLAKVQGVEMEGGTRNIFDLSTAPIPPEMISAPPPKVPNVGKIAVNGAKPAAGAAGPANGPTGPTGPTGPVPLTLKYYGYSTKRSDGEKKAFFLDGDDIIVASEGDVIKKQYKVVRIGVNSVQMEDTHSKTTQTLPLLQEVAPA